MNLFGIAAAGALAAGWGILAIADELGFPLATRREKIKSV